MAIGGDETGAIVGDVGTHLSKFGFAGEDTPKCVLSSRVASIAGSVPEEIDASFDLPENYPEVQKRPEYVQRKLFEIDWVNGEPAGPLSNGSLDDWDVVEYLWDRALTSLRYDERNPVLCGIPSWTTPAAQEKYFELMFERFDAPAVYLSRNAALASFSCGRSSALVVDCGAGSSSVSSVIDGYALLRATKRSNVGGDFIDKKLLEKLGEVKLRCVARAEKLDRKPPEVTLMKEFGQLEVAREVKESLSSQQLELPDGTTIDASDVLSARDLVFQDGDDGLNGLVRKSLSDADVDVRKDLLQNVVVCGAGSLFEGLPERLHREMSAELSTPFRPKMIVPSHIERSMAVWIGGSVLASLGSFQQQWLSREEYYADGPLAAQERWN